MNSQLRDVFRHGLIKAAESTGILLSLHEVSESIYIHMLETVLTTYTGCSELYTVYYINFHWQYYLP